MVRRAEFPRPDGIDIYKLKERNLETEIIHGLALAAILFGFGMLAAALAVGGSVPMIGLGLIVAALSMDLFRVAKARDEK